MASLSYLFRVGKSTLSNIISETTKIIWEVLQPVMLPPPDEQIWRKSAEGFQSHWNYPNCLGAIDGKHIAIQVNVE